MEYRQISDDYSVSGQIQPEDIVAIKEAGFRSVICNRPDNEQPGQPSADSVQAAAEAAGLAFRYIPVISGQITMDNVEDQAEALDELEGPVFAYCRSGARCTNLYGLIQQQRRGEFPGQGVLRLRSGRAENGGFREPERSVLKVKYASTAGSRRLQAGFTYIPVHLKSAARRSLSASPARSQSSRAAPIHAAAARR